MTEIAATAPHGFVRTITRIGPIRLVVNAFLLFGAYIGLQLLVQYAAKPLPAMPHRFLVIAGFLALGPVMLFVYARLVRIMERRSAVEISFAPGLTIGGAIFGGALFCAIYAALWAIGVAHWMGWSADSAVALPLAIAVASAIGEELTFRGGIFRVLEGSFGTAVAIVVSAVAFGFVHSTNPGATPISTAAIAIEAGVLLGLAYAATRNLWFPIGLHFGWGFAEGSVFGAAVSGRANHGLLNVPLSGAELLTGGAFGPEASVVAVAVSLAASAALLLVTVRRGHWKKLTFRMLVD